MIDLFCGELTSVFTLRKLLWRKRIDCLQLVSLQMDQKILASTHLTSQQELLGYIHFVAAASEAVGNTWQW